MAADEGKNSKEHKLLAGAVQSASYSMLLQLMLRMLTFTFNAIILRLITKDMLGVVNVRLILLFNTVYFLATDAFDKVGLSKMENQDWTKTINLLWCTVPVSIVIGSVLSWVWLYMLESPDPELVPGYTFAVICFTLSAILEILARPLFIVARKLMFAKLRVLQNGLSELSYCSLTVLLTVVMPENGLVNFAIAHILYGIVGGGIYYVYFTYYMRSRGKKDENFPFHSFRDFFPSFKKGTSFIDIPQAWLAVSIFKQSFLKQLLTEGEKYVMTVFGILSFADQGIYDVVNNLGSMAARFIFLPIEESGYLFFSQLLKRGETFGRQKPDSIKLAVDVLSCLLKFVILIGSVILVFGIPYSYLALDLYGGAVLSSGSGPYLLQWYCLYVLIIAVNGTTECFVFSTMSMTQVDQYNRFMVAFSVIFLLSSLVLTRYLGSVGFILANCLNMAARITHSVYYIEQYFKDSPYRPLHSIFPSPYVIVSLVASLAITHTSQRLFCCDGIFNRLVHIGVGGLCLCGTLAFIYLKETAVVNFVKEQYNARKKQ